MTEAAAVPSVQTTGSIYAMVGSSAPEWVKIVKINPDGTSEVVQDYTVKKAVAAAVQQALAEHADSDDPPEQQQLLMSAWQALAIYLSTCDDEDKPGALAALKMVSNLMADGDGTGPLPTGTFGATTQSAAESYSCPKCVRSFGTEQGLINHLATVHAQRERQPKAPAGGDKD